MSEELKPCGHCGENFISTWDYPVKCCNCGATAATPEEWNTRPLEDALQTKLDKIQAHLKKSQEGCADYDKMYDTIKTCIDIAEG